MRTIDVFRNNFNKVKGDAKAVSAFQKTIKDFFDLPRTKGLKYEEEWLEFMKEVKQHLKDVKAGTWKPNKKDVQVQKSFKNPVGRPSKAAKLLSELTPAEQMALIKLAKELNKMQSIFEAASEIAEKV